MLLGLEYKFFLFLGTPFFETMDEITITPTGTLLGKSSFFGFVPGAASSAVRKKRKDNTTKVA